MTRDQFAADRSLALYARAKAPVAEASLITWSLIALLLVLAAIALGGPA